ncbi:uncharacterized protein LOC117182282 [Belonocnema kinseyi]|uniref:uncharacterized protein LOC117182282 n=1 Tax=Belonocnema kinseyi TaxID=2817044 RepID=UPI00143D8E50|nr:uncharacterized protein LOC117182282 [Belonocnema kinseyi]
MVIVTDLKRIGRLVMGSAYFPYDRDTNAPMEVRTLLEYCKVRGLPLLLESDANSQIHCGAARTSIHKKLENKWCGYQQLFPAMSAIEFQDFVIVDSDVITISYPTDIEILNATTF